MGSPEVERRAALREKLVALVNSCDSLDRTRLMIEDFVGHMGGNAQPSHAGDASPPQIMNSPSSRPRELIENTFRSAEFLERPGSEQREDQRTIPVCALQYGQRLFGEVDDVCLSILRP